MTFTEAEAALKMAPEDDQLSQVEPNMTRRNLKYHALRALNNLKHRFAVHPIPENLARQIACIAQDWTDPVTLHYAYDPHQFDGVLCAWNKEELENRKMRQQGKERCAAAAGFLSEHVGPNEVIKTAKQKMLEKAALERAETAQARAANKIIAEQEARITNMAYGAMGAPAPGTDPYFDFVRRQQLLGMVNSVPKFDPTVIENVPIGDQHDAILFALNALKAAASTGNTQKRDTPPPPVPELEKKPEPKPDPKSPTFVLKRPKLG